MLSPNWCAVENHQHYSLSANRFGKALSNKYIFIKIKQQHYFILNLKQINLVDSIKEDIHLGLYLLFKCNMAL